MGRTISFVSPVLLSPASALERRIGGDSRSGATPSGSPSFRRVPGVGSCGLTKAWSPSFREEEDLLELRRLSVELAREDDDEKLLEAVCVRCNFTFSRCFSGKGWKCTVLLL